jgi:hypothetical protein
MKVVSSSATDRPARSMWVMRVSVEPDWGGGS